MAKGQYSRKSATRDERKKILIVCEGEKTEPNYFRSFRYPKDVVEVSVDGAGCETIRVVERAIERRDKANNSKNPYDEIWCVFDRDSFPKTHFYNALAMARKQSFRLAYSIEAFELWYLLHFEYRDAAMSRIDYSEKLERYLKRKYLKNDVKMYESIADKTGDAIRNADRLLKFQQEQHSSKEYDRNPVTHVFELVNVLRSYKTKP
ncbi:MAG: RloB family protein [Bacillota bacterium]